MIQLKITEKFSFISGILCAFYNRFLCQANPCGIYGGQSDAEAGFSAHALVFSCYCIYISFIHFWCHIVSLSPVPDNINVELIKCAHRTCSFCDVFSSSGICFNLCGIELISKCTAFTRTTLKLTMWEKIHCFLWKVGNV